MHKQENTSSKGDNQHFSAVLSPLTLPKLLGKHFPQFIGANKRYQENRKFDKPTPSKADGGIDGTDKFLYELQLSIFSKDANFIPILNENCSNEIQGHLWSTSFQNMFGSIEKDDFPSFFQSLFFSSLVPIYGF